MTYDTPRTTGAATPTMARPTWSLVKADELMGRTVIGLNDETIGTVNDLFIDHDEHTIRYATVDVGGFLGIGAKTVLIPFESLQWSGDDLYLPVERDVLERAPEFDPAYDREYEESVTTAWGVSPYWMGPDYGRQHSHWRTGYGPEREIR